MERKHAVITGASQGIGRAIAEIFLREGFSVFVCGRTANLLAEIRQKWGAEFGEDRVFVYQTDVAQEAGVKEFAQQIIKDTGGKIDVLVNNAGAFLQGDVTTEPDGQLQQMLNVNLMSAYHLSRAIIPSMKSARRGHIFNMCSIASLKAYPGGGAYSISKYALLGFSDNLREELKPHAIRVTSICPGAVWTGSWSNSGVEQSRIMEAADVAKMVWAAYTLSAQADVETIVMRPTQGDL